MSKKLKKQPTTRQALPSLNVALPESVSKEELKQLIVDAYFEIENVKTTREEQQREKDREEWRKIIGFKNYDNKIKNALNHFCVFIRVIFLSKKNMKGVSITSELFKLFLSFVFSIIKWGLILFAGFVIIGIFYNPIGNVINWINALLYALLLLMFSRFFRLASIEMSKVEDHGYIFGAFTCVAAFIAIILATISIIVGVSV